MDPLTINALGSVLGGTLGWLNSRGQARAQERAAAQAAQTAAGGYNWFANSPLAKQYIPAGGAATANMAGLLGAGGDVAGGRLGFENYADSVDLGGQLTLGNNAIVDAAAAGGGLNSGATLRALQSNQHSLRARTFDNYLAHLTGLSNTGLNASAMVGGAAENAAMAAANFQFGGGNAAAGTRANGWDQLFGGLGGAYEAWQAKRSMPAPAPIALPRHSPAPLLPNPLAGEAGVFRRPTQPFLIPSRAY